MKGGSFWVESKSQHEYMDRDRNGTKREGRKIKKLQLSKVNKLFIKVFPLGSYAVESGELEFQSVLDKENFDLL